MNQNSHDFDTLIGKKITDSSLEYRLLYIDEKSGDKIYNISTNRLYFNLSEIKGVIIATDSEMIVSRISIELNRAIDEILYKSLISKYGNPSTILCRSRTIYEDTRTSDGISTAEKKYSLKECSFNDNPLFIGWKKENFELNFTILRDLDKTELLISKL